MREYEDPSGDRAEAVVETRQPGTGARAATARESNAAAARRTLWRALDTTRCGRPEVVRAFFELLPFDTRIVDVGCWNGAIAALAASSIGPGEPPDNGASRAPWRSYTGVDVVTEAVDEFRAVHARRPRTDAVVGDVRALPLNDDSADVVLCLFVLQDMEGHRADGLRALSELARVARPGAELLIGLTVHSLHEEETFYVVKKLRREGIPEKPTHHWRRADFLMALRAAGFRVTRLDEFGPNERGFVELYARAVSDGSAHIRTSGGTVPAGLLPEAPKLFVDYVGGFARVRELFAHDYRDPGSLERASQLAAARVLPRDQVADVLLEQAAGFRSGHAAAANIAKLRDCDTAAVVTGQQPSLFGGPLYNLYKAVTAVKLAQRLEAQTGRAHVPVFWIANDDHELSRVDHVHVLLEDGRLEQVAWQREGARSVRPISSVRLDKGVADALEHFGAAAGRSPHREAVLDLLSGFARLGERLTDAFGGLLGRLLEPWGLVLVDPSDARLRRLGMPRLAAELTFPPPTAVVARPATAAVAALGFPVQVPLRDDRLSLFCGRDERFRVRCGPAGFQIGRGSGKLDAAALRARFEEAPEEFSPNVLLRPVYQDAVLPTAAYVAGPSEIAYFAQLKRVYELFDLPMPVVYPRLSATLVGTRAQALLRRTDRSLEDVWAEGAAADGSADLQWLSSYLLPGGRAQERVLGIVQGLLDWGPALAERVLATAELGVFDHQILDGTAPGG